MKRHRFAPTFWTAAAAALLAAGCLGAVTVVFTVEEPVPEQTVTGNPSGGVLGNDDFGPVPLDVTAEQEYQQQDFDYVKRLELTGLTFSITASSEDSSVDPLEDGNPDDFSFFDSIEVYIEATIDGVASSALVAYLNSGDPQFSPGSTTLNLETTGVDILAYMEAPGGYTIKIHATGTLPPDDVIFDGTATYKVTAGLTR